MKTSRTNTYLAPQMSEYVVQSNAVVCASNDPSAGILEENFFELL